MSQQEMKVTIVAYNTIRATLTLTDLDGSTLITNCTNHTVKLMKPDNTQKGSDYTAPTNNDDGTYTQDLEIAEDDPSGIWEIDWRIIYAAKPSRSIAKFKVE